MLQWKGLEIKYLWFETLAGYYWKFPNYGDNEVCGFKIKAMEHGFDSWLHFTYTSV